MKWYEILWQLPQYILGYLYLLVNYKNVMSGFMYNGASYYILKNQRGSATFCKDYVFLSKKAWHNDHIIKHEYGHTIQSKWLGWLYLLVIGLPSIIWEFIHSNFNTGKKYEDFYTEKWANKLGKC